MAILLLLLAFGAIDLLRMVQSNNTVAEAARQGARQAIANAASSDSPFGSPSGVCSGIVPTQQANGTGCLTDSQVRTTVSAVLAPLTSTVNLYQNTPARSCPTPAGGAASLCVTPADFGPGGPYSDCAGARAALGREPVAGELGARQAEWQDPKYRGCYLVQVTVVYSYSPLVGFAQPLAGSQFRLSSSTTMLAEY